MCCCFSQILTDFPVARQSGGVKSRAMNEVIAPNPFINTGAVLVTTNPTGRDCRETPTLTINPTTNKITGTFMDLVNGLLELGSPGLNGGTIIFYNSSNSHATTITGGTPVAPVNLSLPLTSGMIATTADIASACSSGVYIPTTSLPADSNLATAAASSGRWMRIGSIVAVSGQVSVSPVAGSRMTGFELTLPVPSTVPNAYELSGVAANSGASPGCEVRIFANTTTQKAVFQWWQSPNVGPMIIGYNFSYRVV